MGGVRRRLGRNTRRSSGSITIVTSTIYFISEFRETVNKGRFRRDSWSPVGCGGRRMGDDGFGLCRGTANCSATCGIERFRGRVHDGDPPMEVEYRC